jgi:hypothetical protein
MFIYICKFIFISNFPQFKKKTMHSLHSILHASIIYNSFKHSASNKIITIKKKNLREIMNK